MDEAIGSEDVTSSETTSPVIGADRIGSLDFIRGIAVMGILAANIVAFGQPFAAYMYPDSFLTEHGPKIRAIATRGELGANAAMIAACPQLEVISVYGVGYDAVNKVGGTSSLLLDGVNAAVLLGTVSYPTTAFTISAWVAPQEYSYNLSAIINRQQNFQKGYFFGINHIGQLVGVGGKWQHGEQCGTE